MLMLPHLLPGEVEGAEEAQRNRLPLARFDIAVAAAVAGVAGIAATTAVLAAAAVEGVVVAAAFAS